MSCMVTTLHYTLTGGDSYSPEHVWFKIMELVLKRHDKNASGML